MEILAPAGSPESLRAAAAHGADAVYLGLDALNARRGAKNFDRTALLEAAEICAGAKIDIHLTLNTLLFEQELPAALDVLKTACEAGVAAVIVQDPGAARLVRECAPQLRLHASTQMAIHNLSGVLEAARMGFSRVVLARELTLAEIEAICRRSPVEIEVFCHGALCMSLSGRCLLSSVAGGRSGNRGLCAQPCRQPYRLGGKDGYPLSPKDLSLLTPEWMSALERAGVSSVKIEGRMKRPEYVAAAVDAARAARGGQRPDIRLLREVFSRSGFTDGYLSGRLGRDMFGVRTPEDTRASLLHRGEPQRDLPHEPVRPKPFFHMDIPSPPRHSGRRRPRLRAALSDMSQWSPALSDTCEFIALYPDTLLRLGDTALPYAEKILVREPPASFSDTALRDSLTRLYAMGFRHFLALSLGGIRLGREAGFILHGASPLNLTNSLALEELEKLGLLDCTLSVELSAGRIAHLGGALPRGIEAYGRLPLMVLRNCPVRAFAGCGRCKAGAGAIQDRQKRRFPVSCAGGTAQLYNSDTLWLADKLRDFKGLDFVWLSFVDEDAAGVLSTVQAYKDAAPPPEGMAFTRGLYYRKVN